jgi:hypothetical protein
VAVGGAELAGAPVSSGARCLAGAALEFEATLVLDACGGCGAPWSSRPGWPLRLSRRTRSIAGSRRIAGSWLFVLALRGSDVPRGPRDEAFELATDEALVVEDDLALADSR